MITNYDKDTGRLTFFNTFKNEIPIISKSVEDFFNKLSKKPDINLWSTDQLIAYAEELNIADEYLAAFINDSKYAEKSLSNYKQYLIDIGNQTSTFSNLKNIGGTLLSTFSNMAVMYAASAAIEGIITALSDYIHRLDIAIEKGEEAKSAIDKSFNTYSDKQNTITDMGKQFAKSEDDIKSTGDAIESVAKKYDELSKGVNNLTNENMSLTDDEYQTYLQTCNQLAEIFPSLVTGYDEQGNALISLGNGAQSANDQLTALLDTQRQIANMDMGKNLQDIYEGVLAQDEKYRNEIALYQSKRGNLESKQTERATFLEQIKDGITSNTFTGSRDFIAKLQTALSKQGIYAFDVKDIDLSSNKGAEAKGFSQMLTLRSSMSEEQLNEVYNYLEAYFANENDLSDAETAKLKELENTTELKRKDNQKSISDYISKYIMTKDSVSNFDVSLQNALSNSLASMVNFDVIDNSFGGDIEQYLYSKFIVPLSEISKDGQKEIAKLFDLDKNEISLKDYNKQVNDVFEKLFPDDKQLQNSMKKSFGFQDVISDAYKQTQALYSKFGDNIKEIDKMSVGDREIAYNLVINGFTGTFDELQKKINETANLDDISSSVTAFQDAYNSLQKAIGEQNSTGYISNDTVKALTENNTLYAECLYKTASGMQLDIQKANDLSKAQSELNLAALEANKTLKQAEYDKNVAEMERLAGGAENLKQILDGTLTGDYDDIFSLNSANEEIQTQIDSWSELENSIRGTMSALQQYKDAQSSANASDNYQTIVSGKKDADKLYKQGWTTKDDFTSYALLLAENGASIDEAVSNYESNAKRFSRYLTEDTSGLYNFLDDAVDKSKELGNTFVTVGEDGKYAFDITSMNDFADSMSMNTQMAENFMLALKDMGFNVDLSVIGDSFAESVSEIDTSAEDATQQVQGIIDRMQELSQHGVDVSGSFDAVSSALQSLNGNGVDVSSMVSQLNEIMNGSGYQIDPVTLQVVGEADMSQVEKAEESVSDETLEKTVKYNADTSDLDSTNIAPTQSTTVNVESDNIAVKTGTDEAVDYASGKKAIMKIDADNSPAKSKSNEAKSYADGLTGTISVNANTSGISSSISNALSGSYSINVKANVSGLPSKAASAKVYGTAHANGTASPHISSAKFKDGVLGSAYASGNWGVDRDQDALIGEIAPEILVRNGRFMTVGNYGAEMVHLRKGDIIFNHKQSEAILKNGYVTGRGKVIGGNAHVNGTAGNAYYNSSTTGGGTNLTKRPGQSLGSGTYKNSSNSNTKATNDNTDAKKKNTKETKKSTQVFDWVKERLEYFADKTKAIADTITDYVTSVFKQAQLQKQMNSVQKEIDANEKGYNVYTKKANGIKLSSSWKKKVQQGTFKIENVKNKKLAEKIQDYQKWYEICYIT